MQTERRGWCGWTDLRNAGVTPEDQVAEAIELVASMRSFCSPITPPPSPPGSGTRPCPRRRSM